MTTGQADDRALRAAVALFGEERGYELLGCDWGRSVGLPDTTNPCTHQATQRICLHHPDGFVSEVKVCLDHHTVISDHTNPRCDGDGEAPCIGSLSN